jgi:sialidase-1
MSHLKRTNNLLIGQRRAGEITPSQHCSNNGLHVVKRNFFVMKKIWINGILIVVFLWSVNCANAQNHPDVVSQPITVFEPGTSYATTRIPALVSTKKGTLLAFCEARANATSDWAEIDLILRRSTDKGKTWEPNVVIVPREKGGPLGNPTPIVDRDGTIHLLFQRNYAKAYYMQSADDGVTWSVPRDITYAFDKFRPEYNWKVIAPGPGHAIQLKGGRLLVPVWICEPDPSIPGGHRPSCVATVYSDNKGETWSRGEIISCNNDPFKNPSESVAAELSNGRIMMNIRNEGDEKKRMISYSTDGISHWSQPVFDTALYEPICMASMIKTHDGNSVLFVNPDSQHLNDGKTSSISRRKNLTVKLSNDEGKTWITEKVLEPGNAGYSDLAIGADGRIYCIYETNESEGWKYKIVLRSFTLDWIVGAETRRR